MLPQLDGLKFMALNFEVFIIRTLPVKFIENCLLSLEETLPERFDISRIKTINERNTRETTLNEIISVRDSDKDLFIVADDIIFIPGWYEKLVEYYTNGEIIGFSMIDAERDYLQDFGYDIICVDGEITFRGLYKYKHQDELKLPVLRECDAVTGCAMYIKKGVLNKVKEFPMDGSNRWGELIFCQIAKQYGHRTIVLSASLKHYGISTKQKNSISSSSISWLVEQKLWKNNVVKYLKDVVPKEKITSKVSKSLKDLIYNFDKCLIYGAGTIANSLLLSLVSSKNVDICTGLQEEVNLKLLNKVILDVNKIDKSIYDAIVVTSVGYEHLIIPSYFSNLLDKIIILESKQDSNILNIKISNNGSFLS